MGSGPHSPVPAGLGRRPSSSFPAWRTSDQSPAQSLHSASRSCSPLCNPQFCVRAPEALPSLVSLGSTGGRPSLSLAGSASPFPFLTALLSLFNTLARIHKGLCDQVRPRRLVRAQAGMRGVVEGAEGQDGTKGARWGREVSPASPHLYELAGGGGSHLRNPRKDQSHLQI